VEPIDLGDELRQGVQSRLDLAPVVLCPPIASELLSRRELHALRVIRDRLSLRPPGRVDAPAQVGELRIRKIDMERTDRTRVRCLLAASGWCTGLCHVALLFSSSGSAW